MKELVTCKNCGYQWEKGTDSNHSKDDCIERLRAERDLLNEAFLLSYNHLCDFIFACKNRKNMPMDSFINDIIKEAELTAETNPLFIQEYNKDLPTEQGE